LNQWRNNGLLGKSWCEAKRLCDAKITDARTSVQDALQAFFTLGAALIGARDDEAPLKEAVADSCCWKDFERLVAHFAGLTDTMEANPLTYVAQGYHRFRRYAPRMLEALQISAAPVACRASIRTQTQFWGQVGRA
jgi:hypothetical protein